MAVTLKIAGTTKKVNGFCPKTCTIFLGGIWTKRGERRGCFSRGDDTLVLQQNEISHHKRNLQWLAMIRYAFLHI